VSDAGPTTGTSSTGVSRADPGELDIRIVAGGPLEAVEESALVLAVRRVLAAREGRQQSRGTTWGRAGRLEAVHGRRVTARGQLPDGSGPAAS